MQNLPPSILLHIFNFSLFDDSFVLVCKNFARSFSANAVLEDHGLEVCRFPFDKARVGLRTKHIIFYRHIPTDFDFEFFRVCPQLETVEFNQGFAYSKREMNTFVSCCPNIQHIVSSGCMRLNRIVDRYPNLVSLKLRNVRGTIPVFTKQSMVKHLELYNVKEFNWEFLTHCSNVETLILHDVDMTLAQAIDISKHCPNVKKLTARHNYQFINDCVLQFIDVFPLEELNVMILCGNVTDYLQRIFQKKKLVHLKIRSAKPLTVTPQWFRELPRLKSIRLQ
jgi:hypothetical protein